jgi:hypothetical protein
MPANGTRVPRRTLADEITKLEQLLDGLADGLNAAVAEAMREAAGGTVREAVRAALAEALAGPEVARLVAAAAPTAVSIGRKPSAMDRLRALCRRAAGAVHALRRRCHEAAAGLVGDVAATAASAWQSRWLLRRFAVQILAAVGVGVALGAAAWYAGPWLASLSSGAGGFCTAIAVQAGLWLRRVFASPRRDET